MYSLLKEKRFFPVFLTQFLGAFNDNVFKNALVIFIAYKAITETESGMLSSFAAGLFIIPYLIFSVIAGQLADKYEKSEFIVKTKLVEIFAMFLGAVGFYLENFYFLLFVLFLMGTQSTFFGPAKYSILPQMFRKDSDLMEATGLVEMGTFLAILTGTIVGGVLIAIDKYMVCLFIVVFSLLGWLASRKIPRIGISNPRIVIRINPIKQLKLIFKVFFQSHSIVFSILLISWFWFFGAVFLTQIAVYVRYMVNADKTFVTVFLTAFTLSLSIGSVICNRLSQKKIELALIVVGSLGMSFFAFDLGLVEYPVFRIGVSNLTDIWYTPELSRFIRVTLDFFFVGFFGSFYIVPLYAFLQRRSLSQSCSQAIAGNNIVNAIFMVASTIYGIYFYKMGYSTAQLFSFTASLNFVIFICFLLFMPEIHQRFVIWLQEKTIYDFTLSSGFSQLKGQEKMIIVGNFSSYGLMLLTYFLNRPVRLLTRKSPVFMDSLKSILNRSIVCQVFKDLDFNKKIVGPLRRKELIFISSRDYRVLERTYPNFGQECKKHSINVYKFSKKKSSKVRQHILFEKREVYIELNPL